MKLDYRTPLYCKTSKKRHHLQITLGALALICITLAIYPYSNIKNSKVESLQTASQSTTITLPLELFPTEIKALELAHVDSKLETRVQTKIDSNEFKKSEVKKNESNKNNQSHQGNKSNHGTKVTEAKVNETKIDAQAIDSKTDSNSNSNSKTDSKTIISTVSKLNQKSSLAKIDSNANTNTNTNANRTTNTAVNTATIATANGVTSIPGATTTATNIATNTVTTIGATTSPKWHTVKIQKNDTLAKVFQRHGFSKSDLQNIMSSANAKSHLTSLQPGQTLKLQVSPTKTIEGLVLEVSAENTVTVAKKGEDFEITTKTTPVENKIAFGKGEIRASLIASAKRAGLDTSIVNQMVEIFGGNIDFSLDLRPNDTFRVLFEQKCLPDGERVKTGHILAAEINNGGKKIQAIRYSPKSGPSGYFSPEGTGLTQAFLRCPVNFTSISSGFGQRLHPKLHRMRQHRGVDYAAPRGTPVQATGDAKVVFVGNKAGYGKVIELAHGARYTTLYAHLSRFAKNLKVGKEIKQGEVIGFVGRTGCATGDHLHYEFRIDGIHRDPLTVAFPKSKYIPDNQKRQFLAHAKEMLRLMDLHEQKISVASVEFTINE